MTTPSRPGGRVALALAVFVLAFASQLPFFDRWFGLLDEGYVLSIAEDVRGGALLYRDVTVDAPFPAAFHLLAWWFGVAGTSIRASRWLAVTGFAVFATALALVARAVLSGRATAAFVVVLLAYRVLAFPHWQAYSYSLLAATAAATAAAVLLGAARTRSLARLGLAGLVAGVAIAARQDLGVAVTTTLCLLVLALPWLDVPRPRAAEAVAPALAFGSGAMVVVVAILGWFAAHGALKAMIEQTVIFPLTAVTTLRYPALPSLWPVFGQDTALRAEVSSYLPPIITTLWWNPCPTCMLSNLGRGIVWQRTWLWDLLLKLCFWAPLVAVLVATARWLPAARRGDRDTASTPRLLVLALAAGFLLAFNEPRDWVHLMMVCPPHLLLMAVLVSDLDRRISALAARRLRLAAGAAVATLAAVALALVVDLRRVVAYPMPTPRADVFADPMNGPVVEDVLAWVEEHVPPHAPLPVFPSQPMIGFLAGRPALAGYHVIGPLHGQERDARLISALEAEDVGHVVYSVLQGSHAGRFQDNAPALFEALVARYEIERVFSRDVLGPILLGLRRREPATPGTRLRSLAYPTEGGRWETWPFDAVLTQPVGDAHAPSVQRMSLEVPLTESLLRLAAGVNPEQWFGNPTGPVTWTLGLEGEGDEPPSTLWRGTLDVRESVADRGWRPFEVDLSAQAGHPVVLTFTVESAAPIAAGFAGWRDPTFVAGAGMRTAGENPVLAPPADGTRQ